MIKQEVFLENFRELFDETEAEKIQLGTKFKDLEEWSSLIVLSLIVQFEDNYDIKLTPHDIKESITVENLFNLIK